MTRAYSLLGQAAGFDRRVLSIGRVQTPLLGLIARRDAAIEAFRPSPYFVVTAQVRSDVGQGFQARWEPAGRRPPEVDEDGRIVREEVAEGVAGRTRFARGRVVAVTRDAKVEPPPLPYSLADLQIEAARRLGLSAAEVLDACQSLYETHRLTTYPRSDCSYLPEGHLADVKAVLAAIASVEPDLVPLVGEADPSLRSRAWDDSKVTAHHAIVPTRAVAKERLSGTERDIYDLVARRYVSQFLPACESAVARLELDISGERFIAAGRETTRLGWRRVSAGPADVDEGKEAALPSLKEGDPVTVAEASAVRRQTEPPKAFTDASLMQAMVHIAAHVEDARVKAILAEADGIGTPATSARRSSRRSSSAATSSGVARAS
jgi:DNA topoisomerase-3